MFAIANFEPVVNWVAGHPNYASVVVFLVSLAESLVVVGLFIPGFLFMGAIGSLIHLGAIGMLSTMLSAILGAICGDSISFWVGHNFKRRLYLKWPFYKFPQWLRRGRLFFMRHGGLSIIIGRFVGPVRPFIPVVAGIMSMSPRKFFAANVISAVCWAPVYILPGFALARFI